MLKYYFWLGILGDDSGKKCLMFRSLMRTENSVMVVTIKNFWKGFLIPVILKTLFSSSHLFRDHTRPAAHRGFGIFSVSIYFILSSYCGRPRLVRRLLETSILHDCYLEDISKYIMWIATLHDYILTVIILEPLWLIVILFGYFNLLWNSWANSSCPHMLMVVWISKCLIDHLWDFFF